MEKTFSNEEKALAWWDSLPNEDRAILKGHYGKSALIHMGEILEIWEREVGVMSKDDVGVLDGNILLDGDDESIILKLEHNNSKGKYELLSICSFECDQTGNKDYYAELFASAPALKKENEKLKTWVDCRNTEIGVLSIENTQLKEQNKELLKALEEIEIKSRFLNGKTSRNSDGGLQIAYLWTVAQNAIESNTK